MQYFLLFIQMLPYILKLVKAAEAFIPESGKGADKKAAVMDATKAVLDGITEISTGGQKDTWTTISPMVSNTIDFAAGMYFPSGNISSPDAG